MTEAHDQSEFTILFQSLLNTKKVYLCNLQLSEMKLNGPEKLICFARLQLLAPSCSIQKLLIETSDQVTCFQKLSSQISHKFGGNSVYQDSWSSSYLLWSSSPCKNRDGWTAWKPVPELQDYNSMYSWKLPTILFYPSLFIRLQAVMVQEVFTNSLAVPTTSATTFKHWNI